MERHTYGLAPFMRKPVVLVFEILSTSGLGFGGDS